MTSVTLIIEKSHSSHALVSSILNRRLKRIWNL